MITISCWYIPPVNSVMLCFLYICLILHPNKTQPFWTCKVCWGLFLVFTYWRNMLYGLIRSQLFPVIYKISHTFVGCTFCFLLYIAISILLKERFTFGVNSSMYFQLELSSLVFLFTVMWHLSECSSIPSLYLIKWSNSNIQRR